MVDKRKRMTSSERRGLLLLTVLLLVMVGLVWVVNGGARASVAEVISGHQDTVTDSRGGVTGISVASSDSVRKRKKMKTSRPVKVIEPRRSPLDEHIPRTPSEG